MATAIDHLRTRVLPAARFDRYLPDGVLFHSGWALWGPLHVPSRFFQGTGYSNQLRVTDAAGYHATLDQAYPNPLYLQPDEYKSAVDEQSARLACDNLDEFPRRYHANGAATSFSYQGSVFSPDRASGGRSQFHQFPELAGLLDAAGAMGSYFNIGAASLDWAMTGHAAFNQDYAVETRTETDQPNEQFLLRRRIISPGRARYVTTAGYLDLSVAWGTRFWPHYLFDIMHPEVVRLCMEHVRDFVTRHARATGFFLLGENSFITPITNFSPHMVAGFIAFMRDALGGSNSLLIARWGIPGLSFGPIPPLNIDIRGPHWNAAVARDYVVYQRVLYRELGAEHYTEAKRARSEGWHSIFGFGPGGLERSAIGSDFASCGDWYGGEAEYYASTKNGLALTADAGRLSGKPIAFGISSPPAPTLLTPIGDPSWPWFRRCLRWMKPENIRFYFREVLTAGISQIGYLKGYAYGLQGDPRSVQAVESGIQETFALRDRALEFMGPFQRVAIHATSLDRFGVLETADDDPSAYLGWQLTIALRKLQVPAAVFSDPTHLTRTFSRWHLRRSLTFVAFPDQPELTAGAYATLMLGPGAGAAIVVVDVTRAALVAAWLAGRGSLDPPVNVTLRGGRPIDSAAISRIRLTAGPTRAFLFAFRNKVPVEGNQKYLDTCAALIAQEFQAFATNRVITRPAFVPAIPGAEIYSNCVTDGLNSLLAVSWAARSALAAQPLTITVEQDWRSRFDRSVVAGFESTIVGGNTIAPTQTRFVHVEAQLNASLSGAIAAGGMATVIAEFRAVVATLEAQGYSAAHARALLDKVSRSLQRGFYSRALAGLRALSRMVFLRARRSGIEVTVTARKAWNKGPAIAVVTNAEAQLVLTLNAHEAQPIVPLQNGQAVLRIQPPRRKRWDFQTSQWRTPSLEEMELNIEVHVTDQETGGHGFVVPSVPTL